MFDFNGENLQVGDKVIVYESHFSSKAYYVGTVVKRNSYRALRYSVEEW